MATGTTSCWVFGFIQLPSQCSLCNVVVLVYTVLGLFNNVHHYRLEQCFLLSHKYFNYIAVFVLVIPLSIYRNSSIDIWRIGSLWTIAVVVLVNIHLAMDIRRWLLLTHLAVWGSILITHTCIVALDCIPSFPNYWTIFHLMGSPIYWITIFLVIVVALLPRFIIKVLHQTFWPSDIQIAREAEILKKRDNFLGYRQDRDST